MATKTRAEMITMVLTRLGVLAQGQPPTADDSSTVGEVIDSLHSRLRQKRMANFTTSAFPEWAQVAFASMAAEELLPTFGVGGEQGQSIRAAAEKGRTDIAAQLAVPKHRVPTKGRYF